MKTIQSAVGAQSNLFKSFRLPFLAILVLCGLFIGGQFVTEHLPSTEKLGSSTIGGGTQPSPENRNMFESGKEEPLGAKILPFVSEIPFSVEDLGFRGSELHANSTGTPTTFSSDFGVTQGFKSGRSTHQSSNAEDAIITVDTERNAAVAIGGNQTCPRCFLGEPIGGNSAPAKMYASIARSKSECSRSNGNVDHYLNMGDDEQTKAIVTGKSQICAPCFTGEPIGGNSAPCKIHGSIAANTYDCKIRTGKAATRLGSFNTTQLFLARLDFGDKNEGRTPTVAAIHT